MKNILLVINVIILISYQLLYKLFLIYNGEIYQYIINPIILFIFALIFYFLFYNQKTFKFDSRVRNIVTINVLIYIIIYFTIGFFTGYINNPYSTNLNGLIINIFSIIFVYFSLEVLRGVLVSNVNKKRYYVLIFLIFILFDINFNTELTPKTFSLEIIPLIITNIYFIYILTKSNFITNFIYRTLLFLPSFISPIVPDINISILTLMTILLPLLNYIIIEYTIKSHEKYTPQDISSILNPRKWITSFSIIILIIFFALGVFTIYPVVILTGSMKPLITEGDILIIKKCDIEDVTTGDIIEFNVNNKKIVHRVVNKKTNKKQILLTTKGDNNKSIDKDIVTKDNLTGCYSFKIKYLGYPSYFIKNIFS